MARRHKFQPNARPCKQYTRPQSVEFRIRIGAQATRNEVTLSDCCYLLVRLLALYKKHLHICHPATI